MKTKKAKRAKSHRLLPVSRITWWKRHAFLTPRGDVVLPESSERFWSAVTNSLRLCGGYVWSPWYFLDLSGSPIFDVRRLWILIGTFFLLYAIIGSNNNIFYDDAQPGVRSQPLPHRKLFSFIAIWSGCVQVFPSGYFLIILITFHNAWESFELHSPDSRCSWSTTYGPDRVPGGGSCHHSVLVCWHWHPFHLEEVRVSWGVHAFESFWTKRVHMYTRVKGTLYIKSRSEKQICKKGRKNTHIKMATSKKRRDDFALVFTRGP